ncbi:MAG: 4-hydroxy-3-methylbut-2-enyl diphosphate reductase [Acidobacteria bacterium]|nr:4-hydroxy-3-methylbut-2-enyl diphosphate reductase [Acidobacteriota bacterium]
MPPLIFRKGLDLKREVAGALAEDYHSALIEQIKGSDFRFRSGRLTLQLAREFGFCYGVDRAVDYAYQTRRRFPDRRIYLTGEIIHNPHVNGKLRALGIGFLTDSPSPAETLGPDDVVILPAFGVTVSMLEDLQRQGCTLVDTTCGSVLNVWKAVRRYAEDRFTAIIHGKVHHEETRATASQALEFPHGRYLIVLNSAEAALVCDYIRHGGDKKRFFEHFAQTVSPGFDPDVDLRRIGLANQTTMLMSESLEIGEMLRRAVADRYGEANLAGHYRAFETICSATQDRQDAVRALLDGDSVAPTERLTMMIVIGGYNSSNTLNLARLCAQRIRTYHVADATGLVSAEEIRHRPVGARQQTLTRDWLPPEGSLLIGLTAGASTPDNIVGEVILKLDGFVNDTSVTHYPYRV